MAHSGPKKAPFGKKLFFICGMILEPIEGPELVLGWQVVKVNFSLFWVQFSIYFA